VLSLTRPSRVIGGRSAADDANCRKTLSCPRLELATRSLRVLTSKDIASQVLAPDRQIVMNSAQVEATRHSAWSLVDVCAENRRPISTHQPL
jgi:hypothetical protein